METTQSGIGHQILERQFANALFNARADHRTLSTEIIAEIRRYLAAYPDYALQILEQLRTANWTIEEMQRLFLERE